VNERPLTVAEQAELDRLIAEQSADDATHQLWSRERSLDASMVQGEGEFTLLDTLGEQDDRLLDLVGDNETFVRLISTRRTTDEDVKLWRYLRVRQGWTYKQIAEHAGVNPKTVMRHISRGKTRSTAQALALRNQEKRALLAYQAGAKLIEIAEVLYEEAGYKTPESCYHGLRRLFLLRGHAIRPKSWKHGMRSKAAPHETYIAYWKQQNRKARDRRRAALGRCEGTTRQGTRCSRYARQGTTLCNVHSGLAGGPTVWTPEAVLDALNSWKDTHGNYPRPREWTKAAVEHPTFNTVYSRFPSWPKAIEKATRRRYYETREAA
jgi:AraC-like DNA-binding protein